MPSQTSCIGTSDLYIGGSLISVAVSEMLFKSMKDETDFRVLVANLAVVGLMRSRAREQEVNIVFRFQA